IVLKEKGPRRVSPFFIPGRLINLASGYVSIGLGLKGPNHAVVTACSTGAHAIGDAGRLIGLGDADVMLAGGTESPINRLSMAGFAACRALSTSFNDTPTRASRPDGDGIELDAGQRLVGNAASRISMSSTKSSIGHLLGAAGAVEAVFSVLAIRDQVAPPTINLDNPSMETPMDLVPHRARQRDIHVVLSNSFGFGGTNASLVFRHLVD